MNRTTLRWIAFGAAALAVTLLVVFLMDRYPDALAGDDGKIGLTHSLLWLALIGAGLIMHRRFTFSGAFRHAAIWIALGAALVLGYSFRNDMADLGDRLVGELVPHRAQEVDGDVMVRASAGGHFVVEAEVDGHDIPFLIDTGASDVVLSPADARRMGVDFDKLEFTRTYRTANGTVQGAPLRISRLAIGPVSLTNVRASVNSADMNRSLLGMSFLGRLSGYEVTGDRLILKQ